MLLTTIISLFTVRVVLDSLGVIDYGIFNVVGGIVTVFSFLSGTMASASQRFFSIEIGKSNEIKLRETFSVTLIIYFFIALFVFIVTQTLGFWVLNNKLVIPVERIEAANFVYQLSIFSFIVNIISIPYQALIIAREKMKVYAYVSFVESFFKLLIVCSLIYLSVDKLKLYSTLMFFSSFAITVLYFSYCKKKFKESIFKFSKNKIMFSQIMSYSLWNIWGSLALVLRNQGVNILLNIFFNPAVNAARAIAFQLNNVITNFSNNFFTAVRPQITKSFTLRDSSYLNRLVFGSSKIGFFLVLLFTIPFILETNFVLTLWLGKLPNYVVIFTQLVLINTLIEVLNTPIVTLIQASGKVKLYQLTISSLYLLNLPISFTFLKFGYEPQITMIISIIISLIGFLPRLIICQKQTGLSSKEYFKKVILKIILVLLCTLIPLLLINYSFGEGFARLVSILIAEVFLFIPIIFFVGLSIEEKNFIKQIISRKIKNSDFRKILKHEK